MATLAIIEGTIVRAEEQERWIDLTDVGFELLGQTNVVELAKDDALKLLVDSETHLSTDWRKQLRHRGVRIPPAVPLPDYVYPMKDTKPCAQVTSFSPSHLRVMILHERGYYLWHHYYEILVTLSIRRCAELDRLFALQQLESTYGAIYKGLKQGDSAKKVKEVLGEPDKVETSQAVEFFKYSYFKDEIVISFYHGIRRIDHGAKPKVKKEVETSGSKQTDR